jgi:hypothetical protein
MAILSKARKRRLQIKPMLQPYTISFENELPHTQDISAVLFQKGVMKSLYVSCVWLSYKLM